MRRAMPMSAFVMPAVLLIAGVAYARTIDCIDCIDCNGGDCKGTNNADTMNGGPHDDRMLALEGADTLCSPGGMDALKGKGGGERIFGGGGNTRSRAAPARTAAARTG